MFDFEKLAQNGNYELLENTLLKMLEQHPNDVEVLMKLALTEFKFPFYDEIKCLEYLNRILKISPRNFEALVMKIYFLDHHCCCVDEAETEQLISISYNDPQKLAIAHYIKSWIYSPLHTKCNEEREKICLFRSIDLFPYMVYPLKRLGKIFEYEKKIETAKVFFRKALSNVRNVLTTEGNWCITPQSFIDEYITGISLSYVIYNELEKLSE